MVEKIARLHNLQATSAGVLRALTGWAIILAGACLLFLHLFEASLPSGAILHRVAQGGLLASSATAIGALPALFLNSLNTRTHDTMMGFGAGVMLAASFFSLLLPAFGVGQELGLGRSAISLQMATGLALGAAALLWLERSTPHAHQMDGRDSIAHHRAWLFVIAIVMHNIPEGLAIGIAAASDTAASAVSIGIALQNLPEGLIVAIALLGAGYSRRFSVITAMLCGLVEPLAALPGAAAVSISQTLLPGGLAFAAGAMLYVISHEVIPESHRRGHETIATIGLMVGFIIMMCISFALG